MSFNLNEILLKKLENNPNQFTFFQACKILEFANLNQKAFAEGNSSEAEPIQLISHLSFNIPRHQCMSLNLQKRLFAINALALLGANGVLPKYYSEQAFQRSKNHDYTLHNFLNIFEHRYFSLKYKIEKTYEKTLQKQPNFEQKKQISGIFNINLEDVLSPFMCIFLNKNKTIQHLKLLISNLVNAHVNIIQFQEKWYKIPRAYRLVLDRSPLIDKALGEKSKNNQAAILIELTFQTYKNYIEYFENNEQKNRIQKTIKYYLNNSIHFKISIKIKEFVTNTIKLNYKNKLGDTTWL